MTFFFMLSAYFLLRSQIEAENDKPKWIKMDVGCGRCIWSLDGDEVYAAFPGRPCRILLFVSTPSVNQMAFWSKTLVYLSGHRRRLIPYIQSDNSVAGYVAGDHVIRQREPRWLQSRKQLRVHGPHLRNKLTLWLFGIPWHFFYLFILVKLPVTTHRRLVRRARPDVSKVPRRRPLLHILVVLFLVHAVLGSGRKIHPLFCFRIAGDNDHFCDRAGVVRAESI